MLALTGGARVTALHDIDPERCSAGAAACEAEPVASLEAFLEAPVDAVYVASPLPLHVEHAVAALERGKHVLSEVTAAHSRAGAASLIAAARTSQCLYMLAENYRYLDEVELVRRLFLGGRFGHVYFAEGEYLHDCRDLFRSSDGSLTWRGAGGLGVYCTHSLGPLLYILEDRVRTVSALPCHAPGWEPDLRQPVQFLMQMTTDAGRVLRVRVDPTSPRPHQMAYYLLQGTQGAYESWRGLGDRSKVWLADEHEPSRCARGCSWHALDEQAPGLIDDRLAAPAAAPGGHGTSEYWMLRDFLAAVRGEAPVPIDVHRALDYTMPGIVALESAALGGAPLPVPDSRREDLAATRGPAGEV